MSYTTPKDFLIINKISLDSIYEYLLKNDKILLDINGEDKEHSMYIGEYYNNLLNKSILDLTINNSFLDKILYYSNSNSNEYSDTYVINKNKNKLYNIIEIDNSYYSSELMKKYMFMYDFLAEYYRNLSIIKKNKFAIDNKTLYEHTFNMKIRYINKKNFNNIDIITNINNVNNNMYYYLVSFKLEDQKSKTSNEDILIQPTGYITELNIDINYATDDHNTIRKLNKNEMEMYLNSFKNLFNKIIKKENLQINTELSYYHLLAESYKFKYHKLLLTYYISKVIYFYFREYYTTKVKEINDIIINNYPRIFDNFNTIINNSKPDSIITIMENSKKKEYVKNKNKEYELNKIQYNIDKTILERDNINKEVNYNGNNYI